MSVHKIHKQGPIVCTENYIQILKQTIMGKNMKKNVHIYLRGTNGKESACQCRRLRFYP